MGSSPTRSNSSSSRKNRAPERGSILSVVLVPMYCQQGRFEEAGRLIEAQWDQLNETGEGASEQAINFLRLYMDIQRKTALIEAARVYLEHAAQLAPEDDRVWLGRAELAIRDGSYDEAARLLDACLRRRPEDAPVWRARLRYAVATKQLAIVRKALRHLPAEESTPAQIHKLAVWLANQRGDVESERRALERLIATDPTDLSALDRLAELLVGAGQPERATELRQAETRDRAAPGSISEALRAEPTDEGRGGDGPTGDTTRPGVRGQSVPDNCSRRGPRP